MKTCVFGGHYGSEGKGSLSEWLANHRKPDHDGPENKLIVAGDNSPNSGHTCSKGKTRNVPAAGYFADVIMLGPDSVIDLSVLYLDIDNIVSVTGRQPMVIIHEHAAIVEPSDIVSEDQANLVDRVASTKTGSGAARYRKQFFRYGNAVIGSVAKSVRDDIMIVCSSQWFAYQEQFASDDWIFECSQGTLLDVNFGRFPFVTSRSTLPQVAIARNGFDGMKWKYAGVYRTFPIRTGGNSGPTGGREVTAEEIGVQPEVATVTGRTRRMFNFDPDDFMLSLQLTRPDIIAFTHLDYLMLHPDHRDGFLAAMPFDMDDVINIVPHLESLMLSDTLGEFITHKR